MVITIHGRPDRALGERDQEQWKIAQGILETVERGSSHHALMDVNAPDGTRIIRHARLGLSIIFA